MNPLNLKELMISLSDFKKQLSDIITNKKTHLIVKNNKPASVILPYSEFLALSEGNEGYQKMLIEEKKEHQKMLQGVGQDITLDNGIQVMVTAEKGTEGFSKGDIVIKTYIKMKTSGDYKLHYTQYLGRPNDDSNLTTEEYRKCFDDEFNTLEI